MYIGFLQARRFTTILDIDHVSAVLRPAQFVFVSGRIQSRGGKIALVLETGILFMSLVAQGQETGQSESDDTERDAYADSKLCGGFVVRRWTCG